MSNQSYPDEFKIEAVKHIKQMLFGLEAELSGAVE